VGNWLLPQGIICSRKKKQATTDEVRIMIRQERVRVKVAGTDGAVTGLGGVPVLVNLAQSMGLFKDVDALLPGKERDRGYSPSAAVFDLMLIPCAGGECIDDLGVLRADYGLERLLRRKVMAPSTAHDFLRRIQYVGLEGLARVRQRQLSHIAHSQNQTQATLDCDASLFTSRSRSAQMSYKGERGWMPMLAFWAELDLVVNDDFRQGAVSPQGDALNFLKDTVAQLPKTVEQVYVRSDSAWYQAGVLDHCERNGYGFAVTADKDEAVKAALTLINEADWQRINAPVDPDDEERYVREWACESVHTMNESNYSYRIIFLRKERRQGDLFEGAYTYGAIITNRDLPLQELITWHRQRCNCENHIKELKYGFSLNSLPSSDFFVNALYLRIQTLGYNLISALKLIKLPQAWRSFTLKTLRFRLFAVPALVVKHARGLWLKINSTHPHLAVLQPLLR
jgi:hypothetical protein